MPKAANTQELKSFIVRDLHNDHVRAIQAAGFEIEKDSGATIFYDEDDTLIARLFNVSVERVWPSRESSERLVTLAQEYINFDMLDWIGTPHNPTDAKKVTEDVRSLAGCVLSQAAGD